MSKIFIFVVTYFICTCNVYANVDFVKVEKSERKMYLYQGEKILREYHIALGKNPKGHKRQEGDKRTPEGRYTLDYINEESSFYRSVHISYPNEEDTNRAEENGVSPGGFIMVHGQKNGLGWLSTLSQQTDWTNGCIAITDEEMDDFINLVPVGTPIEISW